MPACAFSGAEVISPLELNQVDDDELQKWIGCVLERLPENYSQSGSQSSPRSQPVAPFMTLGIIQRLHAIISQKRGRSESINWQELLALVVASMTGMVVQMADAEYIGQDMQRQATSIKKHLQRGWVADRKASLRAKAKGVDQPPSRVVVLLQTFYKPLYGGAPQELPDGRVIPIKPVPYAAYKEVLVARDTTQSVVAENKRLKVDLIACSSELQDCKRQVIALSYANSRVDLRADKTRRG